MAQGYARQDAISPALSPVYSDVPPEPVDGITTIFTLAAAPYGARAAVFWNGQRLGPSDYTISGSSLIMAWPPTEGMILCDYLT